MKTADDRCPHIINTGAWWGVIRCVLPADHTTSDQPWDHAYAPTQEWCDMTRNVVQFDRSEQPYLVGGQPIDQWRAQYRAAHG
jgi:hypothetical protein